MGKARNKARPAKRPVSSRRRLRFWVGSGVCAAIFAGVAAWALLPRDGASGQATQFQGGARLVVDKDLIDFGPVRYNQFVEARFQLKNVGDKPLQLPASPPVEVVEGC